jgi:hypothetical protein
VDGRRPSTAAGQPAELAAPEVVLLEDEVDSDVDGFDGVAGVELDDDSPAPGPLPARLSVR